MRREPLPEWAEWAIVLGAAAVLFAAGLLIGLIPTG